MRVMLWLCVSVCVWNPKPNRLLNYETLPSTTKLCFWRREKFTNSVETVVNSNFSGNDLYAHWLQFHAAAPLFGRACKFACDLLISHPKSTLFVHVLIVIGPQVIVLVFEALTIIIIDNNRREIHDCVYPDVQRACEKAVEDALSGPAMVGVYVPKCDEQGNYRPMQFHSSSGYRWCVDEQGREIDGTSTPPGKPDPDCTQFGGCYNNQRDVWK